MFQNTYIILLLHVQFKFTSGHYIVCIIYIGLYMHAYVYMYMCAYRKNTKLFYISFSNFHELFCLKIYILWS